MDKQVDGKCVTCIHFKVAKIFDHFTHKDGICIHRAVNTSRYKTDSCIDWKAKGKEAQDGSL